MGEELRILVKPHVPNTFCSVFLVCTMSLIFDYSDSCPSVMLTDLSGVLYHEPRPVGNLQKVNRPSIPVIET